MTTENLNKEFFDIIEAAQEKYQDYIELSKLGEINSNKGDSDNLLNRNINHPLNIVLS